ncbi:MAG: hypothetical protein AB4206_05470 [Xenococcaceae cyanobacterium]
MERQVNDGKPFFAYIPFTQPHLPSLPHPEFAGNINLPSKV